MNHNQCQQPFTVSEERDTRSGWRFVVVACERCNIALKGRIPTSVRTFTGERVTLDAKAQESYAARIAEGIAEQLNEVPIPF